MKKLLAIYRGASIGFVSSVPFYLIGEIVLMNNDYLLSSALGDLSVPFLVVFFVYKSYKEASSQNPSKSFNLVGNICIVLFTTFLLGVGIWGFAMGGGF